jgi:hypothetical protein
METKTKILIGAGGVVAGVGGWVAFRKFVKSKTREVLVNEYNFPDVLAYLKLLEKGSGGNWNLPNMEEFLDGLVPVWSVTMPQAAMKDILEKGRDSVFWSPEHKKKANAASEKVLFKAMLAAYETPEEATGAEMATAAGLSLLEDYLEGKDKPKKKTSRD